MEWFKLLFLYFLFLSGFFCYGDSLSYGLYARQVLENQYNYPKGIALFYMVSGQQWDELPDEVKANLLKINPELLKTAFNTYEFDTWDMVGHYLGSLKKAKTDEILEKIRGLNEAYRVRIEGFASDEGVYNKDILKALIIRPNIEMTIPHRADVVITPNLFYQVSETIGGGGGAGGSLSIKKLQKFKSHKGITPNTFYQVSETIGGGGGAGGSLSIKAFKKFDPQAYIEFKGKVAPRNTLQQVQIVKQGKAPDNSPDLWIVSPSWQTLDKYSVSYDKETFLE